MIRSAGKCAGGGRAARREGVGGSRADRAVASVRRDVQRALYTLRSERLLCEQLDYTLLFRWFLDMNMDEASFVPTVFTKNRERLLKHNVASQIFGAIVEQRGRRA